MAAAALITLRETLEASLVVGIILAYLHHTQNRNHNVFVWLGVFVGVLASLILAKLRLSFVAALERRKVRQPASRPLCRVLTACCSEKLGGGWRAA